MQNLVREDSSVHAVVSSSRTTDEGRKNRESAPSAILDRASQLAFFWYVEPATKFQGRAGL
jgi:hypothetical protein